VYAEPVFLSVNLPPPAAAMALLEFQAPISQRDVIVS
jgi:hypothetical protein